MISLLLLIIPLWPFLLHTNPLICSTESEPKYNNNRVHCAVSRETWTTQFSRRWFKIWKMFVFVNFSHYVVNYFFFMWTCISFRLRKRNWNFFAASTRPSRHVVTGVAGSWLRLCCAKCRCLFFWLSHLSIDVHFCSVLKYRFWNAVTTQ